jgi:hypothetical protein
MISRVVWDLRNPTKLVEEGIGKRREKGTI